MRFVISCCSFYYKIEILPERDGRPLQATSAGVREKHHNRVLHWQNKNASRAHQGTRGVQSRGSTLAFAHAGPTAGQPDNGGLTGGHYAPRSRMHFAASAVGTLTAGGAPSLPFG